LWAAHFAGLAIMRSVIAPSLGGLPEHRHAGKPVEQLAKSLAARDRLQPSKALALLKEYATGRWE
jgi:hypothetical protein